MEMNDMIMVSVDDHLFEPGDLYDRHLPADLLATAPKLHVSNESKSYWRYQNVVYPMVGLNAVMGRVPEEFGMEPTSLSQMRQGCYDAKKRLGDMDANGLAASLNFPAAVVMDGSLFQRANDKQLALRHLQAYNDWHIDEWCGADPARFIPCGILPTWDMDATVAELGRIARKGAKTVSINDNPTKNGLPSIHNPYWEPFFKAIVDNDITISLHIGAGNPAPHASTETPIDAWITTMPFSVGIGIIDWLNLKAVQQHPELRICVAEGGIGWVPALIERADYVYRHHHKWTHSDFGGKLPSELFREHFMICFIHDPYGLKNLEYIGEDIVAYECDYPHSDSTWPTSPEHLWAQVKDMPRSAIDKITHQNALRFFKFDMFKDYKPEQLTVGALRAQASTAGVDVTLQSFGGASPLAGGEVRRVTSGDIINMLQRESQPA